ncbi:ABC transporter substrate-binding protein, partial [Psychrobacter sp. 1U2]
MQKSLFKLTLLATVILGISACSGDNKTTDESAASSDAKAAKTLLYCSEGSPAGFDPAQYTSGTDFDASAYPIYNGLVEFKRADTEIQPGLAESWDISEDGKTYTFNLRKGVKFGK